MKTVKITVFLLAGIGASTQAIDLRTDVICNDLKKSIEQAQPVEKITVAFEKSARVGKLSSIDREVLEKQVIIYAQEQKDVAEKALTVLGNKTYDASKIAWGAAQLVSGILCTACVSKVLLIYLNRTSIWDLLNIPIYLRFSKFYWDYLAKYIKDYGMIPKGVKILIPVELIAYTLLAPYLAYKGANNLYQGINHKKLLKDKIANLDAIITHFDAQKENQEDTADRKMHKVA